MGKLADAQPKN